MRGGERHRAAMGGAFLIMAAAEVFVFSAKAETPVEQKARVERIDVVLAPCLEPVPARRTGLALFCSPFTQAYNR